MRSKIWENIVVNPSIGEIVIPKLFIIQIVIPTRKIGRAKLFKLNEENPAVENLIKLYDTLLYLETEKYFTKKVEAIVR